MTIITPTYAQQQEQKPNGGSSPFGQATPSHLGEFSPPHVVAAHEPLAGEPFTPPIPPPIPPMTERRGRRRRTEVELPQIPPQIPLPPNVQIPQISTAPVPQPPLKVALVGTAPSSRMLAPYNDLTWKIWGCSPGNMGILPRVDAWFEIHGNLMNPENKHYGEPYINWLKQQQFPVYMQSQRWVPNAITFPYMEMVREFGPYFFTSSFAWMMAFAIVNGAAEIALYGVDMASRDEYILQRGGGQYFMQLAANKGIRVSIPYESDLMQPPPLYGYSDETPMGRKIHMRRQELQSRLGEMRGQRDKLIHDITYLEGALEDTDYYQTVWGGAQS